MGCGVMPGIGARGLRVFDLLHVWINNSSSGATLEVQTLNPKPRCL